jgi:hypothetical protein
LEVIDMMDEDGRERCVECDGKGLLHVDYPHDPGCLLDCAACEDHCHCGRADGKPKWYAPCVYSECSDED